MGIRPFTDLTGDETQLVEQNIGEAYLVVKHVREHIEYVKHVSTHLAEVFRVAQSIEAVDMIVAEIAKIDNVLANLTNITSVADSIATINSVGANLLAITEVHAELPELLDIQANLAAFLAEVETVSSYEGRLATIEGDYLTLAEANASYATAAQGVKADAALAQNKAYSMVRPRLLFQAGESRDLPDGMSFTRASGGYRRTQRGGLEWCLSNVLRHQYGTGGAYRGILIEGPSTNRFVESQNYSSGSWGKGRSTMTAAAALAPDGTLTAYKFAADATTSPNNHYMFQNITTTGIGEKVCVSKHVKAAELSWVRFDFPAAIFGSILSASFNISAGTVGTLSAGVTAGIEALADGWYRIWASAVSTVAASGLMLTYLGENNNDITFPTGVSQLGKGVYIWGSQYENTAYPTSYYPTTTVAATREADLLTADVEELEWRDNEWSMYFEGSIDYIDAAVAVAPLLYARETTNRGAALYSTSASITARWRDAVNNVADSSLRNFVAGESFKAAASAKSSGVVASVAGELGVRIAGTAAPVASEIWIGRGLNSGVGTDTIYLQGCILAFGISDIALSPAELAKLTLSGWQDPEQQEKLSSPRAYRRFLTDFKSIRRSRKTEDFWREVKTLLETDNSYRNDLLNGSRLWLDGSPAIFNDRFEDYQIDIPQYVEIECSDNFLLDMTDLPTSTAPTLFNYTGRFGRPSRPQTADYLKDTTIVPLVAGQVALLGLKKGDRLLFRATEQLNTLIGAFTMEDDVDSLQPATSTFWAAGQIIALNEGKINPDDGYSYRCTAAHTAGATFDSTKFTITGKNARAEDVEIESIVGDTLYLVTGLKFDYPEETKPIITKYLDQGKHAFRNMNVLGNDVAPLNRGDWSAPNDYEVGEMVDPPSGWSPSRNYICLIAHSATTSEPTAIENFALDLAAGRWKDMGSDRLLGIAMSDKLLIEGGRVEGMSGMFARLHSIADLTVRDHVGHGNNKKGTPGGYFFIGGACNKGLIDNTRVRSGSQPFMLSASGSHYGITCNFKFRGCWAHGAFGAYTQHNTSYGTIYDDCEADGNSSEAGSVGYDIRTPSDLNNCRANNFKVGKAILLRSQAMTIDGIDKRGTTIRGFKGINNNGGLILEEDTYATAYPGGNLVVNGFESWDTGIYGGISLVYTLKVNDAAPVLGKVSISGAILDMKSTGHAVQLGGPWPSPKIQAEVVGSGTGRSLYVHAGPGDGGDPGTSPYIPQTGNGPSNIDYDIRQSSSYALPLIQFTTGNETRKLSVAGMTGNRAPITLTDGYTLFHELSGNVFDNAGATGNINVNLPSNAQAGSDFEFLVHAAQTITLIPNAASDDTIQQGSLAPGPIDGSFVIPAQVGLRVRLRGMVDFTKWIIELVDEDEMAPQSLTAASVSLAASQSGRVFDNEGAATNVTVNLPAATKGLEFTFRCVALFAIILDCPAGTTIQHKDGTVSVDGGTATLHAVNAAVGKWAKIVAFKTGVYVIVDCDDPAEWVVA